MPENRNVDPLAQRTLELVNIPSESRNEELAIDYVRAAMPRVPAYDEDTVLFYPGRIVLAGHYDTVPAQDNIPGRIEDGWLYGLGATDMKGGLAVMIELARAAAPFGYLFFGREELPAGESPLPEFFERHGLDCDLVVMLEPTDDAIEAGCQGNINARLTFHGESAHSARPWRGENAISLAVDGLAHLAHVEPHEVEIQRLVFREVLSIVQIEGGIATNVVPARASALLNFRFAPNRTVDEAKARLLELIGNVRADVEIVSVAPPARVAADSELVRTLREVGRLEVHPKQAWTPVSEFSALGLDAINYGPGLTRFAHKRDERVEIAALRRCHDTLARFIATVAS
jgi:succinyl-diaminopimelate desuccinylase